MERKATMEDLERTAWTIRKKLIEMFSYGKAHHFGGSLSCVEILTALYFYKMRYTKESLLDPCRDRFVMSKGHSVPTQYVILSMLGVIPAEELLTIKRVGTRLQGHPDIHKTPGLEAPTGSLGQGLSFANGMAMAGRLDGRGYKVYVVLGDGELQEGQVWEAAMTTSHYGLKDVCVIVDRNRYQSQGEVEKLKGIDPIREKWESFGWEAHKVDGHDMGALCGVLDKIDSRRRERPLAIVADTVKGKGVSFLEGTYKYHNYSLTEEEYEAAVGEIEAKLAGMGEG
jgi:transketolase